VPQLLLLLPPVPLLIQFQLLLVPLLLLLVLAPLLLNLQHG
jgi:hypothetical protein